jgi:RNA-directed DNA polymerase
MISQALVKFKVMYCVSGVISPLLANLYLHYAFDVWMSRRHPKRRFERYADDIVVHCVSEKQAEYLRDKIRNRLKECKLELHPLKTKIVFCRGGYAHGKYKNEKFDFLGDCFQARSMRNKEGKVRSIFYPAISAKARKEIHRKIRSWRIHLRTTQSLEEIAEGINPAVRGWINYYGAHHRSELSYTMYQLNSYLFKVGVSKIQKV